MTIEYKVKEFVTAEEVAEVFKQSGIRRPYNDIDRIEKMLNNADLVITAWHNEELIGVARALTDYSYCCYLSDLAVHNHFQKRGIGKKLIDLVQGQIGENCALILLSAPNAMEYYPNVGFNQADNAFIIPRSS
jgi:N-acetylglutamate synthase-like GNAT family acetyltransferase